MHLPICKAGAALSKHFCLNWGYVLALRIRQSGANARKCSWNTMHFDMESIMRQISRYVWVGAVAAWACLVLLITLPLVIVATLATRARLHGNRSHACAHRVIDAECVRLDKEPGR